MVTFKEKLDKNLLYHQIAMGKECRELIVETVKFWLEFQRDRTDISQPQSCMYQSGWQDAFCLLLEQLDNSNSLNYKSITKGENK